MADAGEPRSAWGAMEDRENRGAEPAATAETAQRMHARNMEKRLLRVVEHIHSAQPQELSLDHLADIAAMSRFHFHRVFHAVTGETAAQATRRIRLDRAAMQLVQDCCPIGQIAADAGYATVPAFSRALPGLTIVEITWPLARPLKN